MSRTRIGIIGCGGMARSHVSRFEGLKDRMTVIAAGAARDLATI